MNITVFKTLLLREYWENKSFVRAPLIISAVLIFSMIVGMFTAQSMIFSLGDDSGFHFDADFDVLSEASSYELTKGMQALQFGVFLSPLIIGMVFVLFFYALGSLYNDRRDRSILFWKSMPVSDLQTVMSKVFSALIVVPVLTAIVAVATQIVGLILMTLMIWFNGGSAWDLLWSHTSFFNVSFNYFASLFMLALVMAPILGWLWLVSAYAKRAAFLIALFFPLGLMLIEGMIFHSANLAKLIGEHLSKTEIIMEGVIMHGHPFAVLSEGGFWGGLLISVAFISGAIYIRRFRDDSY